MNAPGGSYPVGIEVEPQRAQRNRLTVGFRFLLAIPHIILVGPPGLAAGLHVGIGTHRSASESIGGSNGLLGFVAIVGAIFSWFWIVFTGEHPRVLWDLARFYMRWRTNAVAYTALLRDDYPPFGTGSYPASYDVVPPVGPRDRVSVGLRLILVIPHVFLLFFLNIAWFLGSVFAWIVILFTGDYPAGVYDFSVGVMRWTLRVESYLLLLRDEYPPFRLEQ
jgi:hypothetical protein